MIHLVTAIDRICRWLNSLSYVAIFALIGAICIEVFSRYVLGTPTKWAFDISYMTNGAIMMLAVAWTLRQDQHVRVDLLDGVFGPRNRRYLDVLFYLLLATPAFGFLSNAAVQRAYKSFATGEVEMVSPWQPLVWPFQSIIALGLCALTLQCFAKAIRAAIPLSEMETDA